MVGVLQHNPGSHQTKVLLHLVSTTLLQQRCCSSTVEALNAEQGNAQDRTVSSIRILLWSSGTAPGSAPGSAEIQPPGDIF